MLKHDLKNIKNKHIERLYKRYKLLALNIFEWENLPNNIEPRHIENALFDFGQCVLFEDKDYGFVVLPCSDSGDINIYGDSKSVVATGVGYSKKVTLVNSLDSVVNQMDNITKGIRIINNDLKEPLQHIIYDYALAMYNVEKSIRLNVRQQKYPYLVVTDTKNELTMKTLFRKIDEGDDFAIFGSKNINLDNINAINLNTPYVVDKLNNYKYELEREILTDLGLNNTIEKKERLVTDEVNSNNDYIYRKVELMYKTRLEACKLINELYGLNIKVTKVDNFHNELERENGNELENEEFTNLEDKEEI